VNGSDLIHAPRNLVYAEGFFVDNFLAGRVDLLLPRSNRIGVVLGQDEEWKLEHAMNVVNAVRAVHGIEVVAVEVTGARVGARCVRTRSGAYAGALADEGPLLDACRRVLDRGATAIAIASSVEDLPQRAYARHFAGDEPNPVGGAEAVISHLVSSAFGIPAAHAPLVNFRDVELESPIVDARGAAELISVSGLASVLIGLHRAPQARPGVAGTLRGAVSLRDVVAVVAPASALGGPPVLHAVRHGIPVIAVRGNHTILDVTAAALGIDVVEVENYAEAAGVVVALREGIGVGRLLRPLATLDFRSAPARARDGVRQ
jgi:CBS domain-containing protein